MAIVGDTYHWDEHPVVPHNQDGTGHTDTQPDHAIGDIEYQCDAVDGRVMQRACVSHNTMFPGGCGWSEWTAVDSGDESITLIGHTDIADARIQLGIIRIGDNEHYRYHKFINSTWSEWLSAVELLDSESPEIYGAVYRLVMLDTDARTDRQRMYEADELTNRQQTYDTVMEREREHRESEEPQPAVPAEPQPDGTLTVIEDGKLRYRMNQAGDAQEQMYSVPAGWSNWVNIGNLTEEYANNLEATGQLIHEEFNASIPSSGRGSRVVLGTYHWDEHPMVPHNQDDGNGHTDTQPNDNQEPQDKIAVVETNVVEPGNAQIGDVSIGIDSNNNYFYTMFLFNGWNDWLPINYVGDNPVLEATINNLINEHQERTAIETQEALAERQQAYDTVMERERERRESEEPNYIRIVGEQQNSMPFTGDTQIGIDSQHFYYCRRYLSEDIGWSEWIRPEQAPHTTRITVNNLIERHQNESQVEPQPTENHAAQDLTEGITNATRNAAEAMRQMGVGMSETAETMHRFNDSFEDTIVTRHWHTETFQSEVAKIFSDLYNPTDLVDALRCFKDAFKNRFNKSDNFKLTASENIWSYYVNESTGYTPSNIVNIPTFCNPLYKDNVFQLEMITSDTDNILLVPHGTMCPKPIEEIQPKVKRRIKLRSKKNDK